MGCLSHCSASNKAARPSQCLAATIRTQPGIATGGLDLGSVLDLIFARAIELTNADGAVVEARAFLSASRAVAVDARTATPDSMSRSE